MFDLATFDTEIRRLNGIDTAPADVRLTKAFRGTMSENAITAFGPSLGTFVGAIGIAMMTLPALVGDASADPSMTVNGMTIDAFALHKNMSLSDPLLVTMFAQMGTV